WPASASEIEPQRSRSQYGGQHHGRVQSKQDIHDRGAPAQQAPHGGGSTPSGCGSFGEAALSPIAAGLANKSCRLWNDPGLPPFLCPSSTQYDSFMSFG